LFLIHQGLLEFLGRAKFSPHFSPITAKPYQHLPIGFAVSFLAKCTSIMQKCFQMRSELLWKRVARQKAESPSFLACGIVELVSLFSCKLP
jgi:hypothetical protein